MTRLHPIANQRAWILTLSTTIYLVGCNNQQMAASNPFMSPDRVPPPATRTLAPGQAAPYYPGDPMPSAQAVPPGAPAVAQAQARPPIAPIGTNIPSPVAAQPAAPSAPAAFTAPTAAPMSAATAAADPIATPQPLAFTNERSVSIPTDNEQLRFAVPQPSVVPSQPQPQQLIAQPTPPAAQAPQPAVAPMPASDVAQASFNQPVPAPTTSTDSSGPWRSPQINGSNSAVMQAQFVQPQSTQLTAPPAATTAPNIPVQLHGVPSPQVVPQTAPFQVAPTQTPPTQLVPVQHQYAPPPRMRFPSWTDPTTWFTPTSEQDAILAQPPAGHQLIGYMVPGPNGQMQMVPLDQYQQSQSGVQKTTIGSSDGFRARTNTK